MSEQTVPKYATLLYQVRKELDISIAEYFYLDMVYHLSHSGWCYKSLDSVALDMGITRMGVVKLRDRLIERKLIVKNAKGHVKTSVTYNKVIQVEPETYNKVAKRITKFTPDSKLSLPKNNNEINKEKKEPNKLLENGYTNDLHGYEARIRQSARIAQGASL